MFIAQILFYFISLLKFNYLEHLFSVYSQCLHCERVPQTHILWATFVKRYSDVTNEPTVRNTAMIVSKTKTNVCEDISWETQRIKDAQHIDIKFTWKLKL